MHMYICTICEIVMEERSRFDTERIKTTETPSVSWSSGVSRERQRQRETERRKKNIPAIFVPDVRDYVPQKFWGVLELECYVATAIPAVIFHRRSPCLSTPTRQEALVEILVLSMACLDEHTIWHAQSVVFAQAQKGC